MTASVIACPSCGEPIPDKARFCPSCGHATPESLNTRTGQVVAPAKSEVEEGGDQRARLQQALGDGLKIRRLLGRGGFAEVWAAFDVRLKREVAVKTLRYDLVISDSLLERFQREAEAVAKLRHPNIIPIYEVGEGKGVAYFVMPMIEGESLGEALDREGTLSIDEACRVLREVASALAAAHRAGIVHRDVKPDNIMLEGPERRPIVMDFGIAKASSSTDAKLTGTGMALGTPRYMSPEQASGDKDLSPRSDQYALALVGYRMLSGAVPFESDSMPTLILKQITEVPKPIIELRSDVPRQLSDALARALSKDPAARFATMEEFIAAIPGGGGASSSGPSRRRPTETELSRFPGGIFPTWRDPVVLLGILGFVLLVGFNWWDRVPRTAASRRGDAVFVGRAFLTKQGATGSYDESVKLTSDDTALVWLGKNLGRDSTDARALDDRLIYRWTTTWSRNASGGQPRENWSVGVAPNGTIATFSGSVLDSTPGAKLSSDSAQRIAMSFLAGVGIDGGALTRLQDSTVSRAKRTDHIYVWEQPKARLVLHGDTANTRVRVTVAGDRVNAFRAYLRPSAAFLRDARKESAMNVGAPLLVLLIMVAAIGAIVLTVQRQRSDDLHWKTGTQIAIVTTLLLGAGNIPATITGGIGAAVAALIILGVLGVFIVAGLAFGIVSGESLAAEINPPGLVGLEALAGRRLAAQDWRSSVLRGLAIGALIGGIEASTTTVSAIVLWRRDGIPEGVDKSLIWLISVEGLGQALTAMICVFFIVHFIVRYTRRPWIGILFPGVVVAGTALMGGGFQPWPITLAGGIIVALLSWTTWRYGFLTAAVAMWVSLVLTAGVALSMIGTSPFGGAAFVCLASLAVLPALAVIGRKRAA